MPSLVRDLLYLCCFRFVLFLVCAVFGSCPFWFVPYLVRAFFGSCCFWFVLFFGLNSFLLVPFLVFVLCGSCSFWFLLFSVRAAFGSCCFWFAFFLVHAQKPHNRYCHNIGPHMFIIQDRRKTEAEGHYRTVPH